MRQSLAGCEISTSHLTNEPPEAIIRQSRKTIRLLLFTYYSVIVACTVFSYLDHQSHRGTNEASLVQVTDVSGERHSLLVVDL